MLNRVRNVLDMNVKTSREPTWLVGIMAMAIPALLIGVSGVHLGQRVAAAQEAPASKVDDAEPPRLGWADAVPSRTGETDTESNSQAAVPDSQAIKKIALATAEGSGERYRIQTTATGVVLLIL